jgi:hypothetical protein
VHSDEAASTSADDGGRSVRVCVCVVCVCVCVCVAIQPPSTSLTKPAQHQQIHERCTQRADFPEDARWDGHTVLVMIYGHARQLTHTIPRNACKKGDKWFCKKAASVESLALEGLAC